MSVSIVNTGDAIIIKTGISAEMYERLATANPKANTLFVKDEESGSLVPEFVMKRGCIGEFGARGIVCDSVDTDGNLIANIMDSNLGGLKAETRQKKLAERYAVAITRLEALAKQLEVGTKTLDKAEETAAKQITIA